MANYEESTQSGMGYSCPYLYAWNEIIGDWKNYGKVIHRAQGPSKEISEKIYLLEPTSSFRISELEPENSFIDEVTLHLELTSGLRIVLQPLLAELQARDRQYLFIPAYHAAFAEFEWPRGLTAADIAKSYLQITGYYERLESPSLMCRFPATRFTQLSRQSFPGNFIFD